MHAKTYVICNIVLFVVLSKFLHNTQIQHKLLLKDKLANFNYMQSINIYNLLEYFFLLIFKFFYKAKKYNAIKLKFNNLF